MQIRLAVLMTRGNYFLYNLCILIVVIRFISKGCVMAGMIVLTWFLFLVMAWYVWRTAEQKRQQQQSLRRIPVTLSRPQRRQMDEI